MSGAFYHVGGLAGGFPAPQDTVSLETEHLYSQVQGYLEIDHLPDGTHDRIRAVSVTTEEGIQEFGRSQTMAVAEPLQYDPLLFTGNGAMTWPVTPAQLNGLTVALMGNMMHLFGQISGTNVGGVANTQLRIGLPFNQVCAVRGAGFLLYSDAGGALTNGYILTNVDAPYVELYTQPAGNWTITGANNTGVLVNILFPVKLNPV